MNKPVLNAITGVHLTGPATVAAVKEWVALAEKMGVPDDKWLLDCVLSVDFDVKDVEVISCGDHLVDEPVNDILVTLHEHPENKA